MDTDVAIIEEEGEEVFDVKIDEEFRIWKRNAPFLYDVIMSHALEWPSLSVQWLPGCQFGISKEYMEQKMYLSTHTSEGEQNYIMQVTVQLPLPDSEIDMRMYDNDGNANAGYRGLTGKVKEIVRIHHDGEINKARYMPQDPMLLATKAINGDVNLFDIRKHPSIPRDSICRPNYILKGHTKEGYGLAWSSLRKGLLASGSDDQRVCVWDMNASIQDSLNIQPIVEYSEQGDIIEDVAWHSADEHVLASCGDDCTVFFYDIRQKTSVTRLQAHTQEVNTIQFHPQERFLFVTASSDATLSLWDQRNTSQPLHVLKGHSAEIFSAAWNPINPNILASAGVDRRVHLWDLSRIGRTVPSEQEAEGPAELLFVHAGHTAKVNDLSWNPNNEWMLASVGDDNVLQVWQPTEAIYNEAKGDLLDLNLI